MHFTELIKKISPKLRGITRRLKGRFTFFNEDDLFQEAAIHLWMDYKDGRLTDKTDSYILQGCYFHLKNYIRKNYDKASMVSFENATGEEGAVSGLEGVLSLEDPHSCFEFINAKLLIEKINHNGLTKREKEVFNLALEGLTAREIGARLGISHVRVVKLRAKVRDKCRKYLDDPRPA